MTTFCLKAAAMTSPSSSFLASLDAFLADPSELSLSLRPHQLETIAALRDGIAEHGHDAGFFAEKPTRTGKTIIFGALVHALAEPAIILVPSTTIAEQIPGEFAKLGVQLSCGVAAGDRREWDEPILVTTYASLRRHASKVQASGRRVVVLDEVHNALGERTQEALERFRSCLRVGFTATAELTHHGVGDYFPHCIDRLDLKEAAERGLISPLRVYRVIRNADLSKVSFARGDFKADELARVLDTDESKALVLEAYRERAAGCPAVGYAVTVAHAESLAACFAEAGIASAAISGGQSAKEQRRLREAFEAGSIDVLWNCQVLMEGWTTNRATVVLNVATTSSDRVLKQRLGRILRSSPEPKLALDFVDGWDGIKERSKPERRPVSIHDALGRGLYRPGAQVLGPEAEAEERAARSSTFGLRVEGAFSVVTADLESYFHLIRERWRELDPAAIPGADRFAWFDAAIAAGQGADEALLCERLSALEEPETTSFWRRLVRDGVDLELRAAAARRLLELGDRASAKIIAQRLLPKLQGEPLRALLSRALEAEAPLDLDWSAALDMVAVSDDELRAIAAAEWQDLGLIDEALAARQRWPESRAHRALMRLLAPGGLSPFLILNGMRGRAEELVSRGVSGGSMAASARKSAPALLTQIRRLKPDPREALTALLPMLQDPAAPGALRALRLRALIGDAFAEERSTLEGAALRAFAAGVGEALPGAGDAAGLRRGLEALIPGEPEERSLALGEGADAMRRARRVILERLKPKAPPRRPEPPPRERARAGARPATPPLLDSPRLEALRRRLAARQRMTAQRPRPRSATPSSKPRQGSEAGYRKSIAERFRERMAAREQAEKEGEGSAAEPGSQEA